jgi:hypothetical protein
VNTLVVYRASERADAALAELARDAGRRLTVVALAPQENAARGCCDTRSVMWNGIHRQLAQEDLARARLTLDGVGDVDLELVEHPVRRAVEAVVGVAARRGASEIVVVDPARCGIGRRDRRRLRRRSPVPVVSP